MLKVLSKLHDAKAAAQARYAQEGTSEAQDAARTATRDLLVAEFLLDAGYDPLTGQPMRARTERER